MKKLHSLAVLMGITILGITGFQLYWLKENYNREEKTLANKSEVAFRETMEQLQVTKLKLEGLSLDSSHKGKIKILMNEGNDEKVNVHFAPGREIFSTINVIRDKLKDTLKKNPEVKTDMVISMNKNSFTYRNDSIKPRQGGLPGPLRDHLFRVLYGVDSIQDSLKLKEINMAYTNALKQQKLDIPFTVLRLDSPQASYEPTFNEVTVGFVNPITYKLKVGNTFPYLIKRIRLPIVFSILLLGITILSFVLLYKNLLKQRRLAELKNDFISNITHELKTPIATVGVAIEALKNFNAIHDPQRTKEYLDISSNELQRLNLLVDKVLRLSMFEKKEMEFKKEPFDMQELINEVLNIMKLQFEKYHADVKVKTEDDNFMIEADRLHITSVLYNLLDNSLKYSRENPVIEIQLSALPRDIIELKVSDNGIGIAREYQRKIFDKFFRVPMGDHHNIKGYGLGLSYVSEIVRRHMGFIVVDSEIGKGTTFTIKLPRKEADVIYFDDKRKIIKKAINLQFIKKGKPV
jgi:two-component system phosphate regulon sensor histidine kinase PhoR